MKPLKKVSSDCSFHAEQAPKLMSFTFEHPALQNVIEEKITAPSTTRTSIGTVGNIFGGLLDF